MNDQRNRVSNVIELLVCPHGPLVAGNAYTFEVTLRVMNFRLEAGASMRFAVPIGWSPPTRELARPGAVEWSTSGKCLLLGEVVRNRYLQLNLTGGVLETGDTVHISYGVTRGGAEGARVQPWVTDIQPRFGVEIDTDGDGTYEVFADSPPIDVWPAAPSFLHVVLPSVATPGSTVRARATVLDSYGNLCTAVSETAVWGVMNSTVENSVTFENGVASWEVYLDDKGPKWIETRIPSYGLKSLSNPCLVTDDPKRYHVYWGDIHGHSNLSDGAGSPDFYHWYARDVGLLDFCSLTDHDIEYHHAWFTRKVQRLSDDDWLKLSKTIQTYRVPGVFAVLRGYEWTGRPFGDKCVYYAEDSFPIYRYEPDSAGTPEELWEKLNRLDHDRVVVIAHSPTSGFMGTRWSYHSEELERAVEIYSMHGSSEYSGDPMGISGSVPGRSVQDALNRGLRLGITAGGDIHSSQPGNPCLDRGPYRTLRYKPGITGVLVDKLDERALVRALRDRQSLGTTGARILVYFGINGVRMGGEVQLGETQDTPVISVKVYGTSLLAEVQLIRNGEVVHYWKPYQRLLEATWEDASFQEARLNSACYYVRICQSDGERAWSSPIWVRKHIGES